MESKIQIFEAKIEDGIFSSGKKFYPKGTLKKDRVEYFHQDRLRLGKKLGFDRSFGIMQLIVIDSRDEKRRQFGRG